MTDQPTEPDTRPRRALRVFLAGVMPSLLAVVAVAAVITALYVWQNEETASTALIESTRSAASGSGHSAASDDRSASPTASAAPASSSSPPTPEPSASTSAKPSPTKAQPRRSVIVLNQTRRTGLARAVAERLRARGWDVVQTGNFRGGMTATTVYYPSGADDQADELATSLPVSPRTRPRFGNLSTRSLTVVVSDNYPRVR